MNRSFDFAAARAPFKSASQYLSSALTSASSAPSRPGSTSSKHRRSDSLDENYRLESPQSQEKRVGTMDVRATRSNSSSSLQPTASSIPLISLSRSPSPYPRSKSAAQSEDEDDDYYEQVDRPLMTRDIGSGGGKRAVFTQGAVGRFLFDTTLGWYLLNIVLVGCTMGASYMLVFLNRGILWSKAIRFHVLSGETSAKTQQLECTNSPIRLQSRSRNLFSSISVYLALPVSPAVYQNPSTSLALKS